MTALAAVLLLALYYIIFAFSDQDGEASGSASLKVSTQVVEIADKLTNSNWSAAIKKSLAEYFEHPIRRLAHFSEYAGMGMLVYILWRQWMKKGKGLYWLTIAWVLFSAIGDEIHQSFVPGREASVSDVLLDTCGGVFGLGLCIVAEVLYQKWSSRKRRKSTKDAK